MSEKKDKQRYWWRLGLSIPPDVTIRCSIFQPENTGWWNGPFESFEEAKKSAQTYFHTTIGVMTSSLHRLDDIEEADILDVS